MSAVFENIENIENIDPFANSDPNTENDSEELLQEFEAEEHVEARPARPTVSINYQYNTGVRTHYCCQIDAEIHTEGTVILITRADKMTDNNGSSFMTYVIRVGEQGEQEVKRRYSEFESLRKGLMRLYPTLIVPPIPEKHSFADYATLQSKAKEDAAIVDKRKRMLQSFLNRVSNHPQLSNEHVFHRFLTFGQTWNEVLHSPPLSNLPKNILQMSPANLHSHSSSASSSPTNSIAQQTVLPNPSASQSLKNPDKRFVDFETFYNKSASHLSNDLEKTNKRIWKRLSDLSNDYAELGAVYNGFSLIEHSSERKLANAIEKVGLAVDETYAATGAIVDKSNVATEAVDKTAKSLTSSLEAEFSEPLQEYSQFSQVIRQVLKYRHLKHLQLELTEETLEKQKFSLELLEKSEQESRRLEEALAKERGVQGTPIQSAQSNLDSENNENSIGEDGHHNEYLQNEDVLSIPGAYKSSHYKRRSGSKLFSVLSHTIHGIMDVDPAATRRNSIGRTRESIIQLEEALVTATEDLKSISASIKDELDRFEHQKIRDLRDMLINYAKNHVTWCKKNLDSWEEAKAEVENIQT